VPVVVVDLAIEGKTNTRTNVIEEQRIEEGASFPWLPGA